MKVKLGTVGTGTMTTGSSALSSVGFSALPWQGSGTPFSAGDVGAEISVIGAGANIPFTPAFGPTGKMLVSTVATVINGANCTISASASNNTQPGAANVVIYRPVSCQSGSISFDWTLNSIAKSTMSFTLQSRDGSTLVTEGMPVLVTEPTLGIMWGGLIQKVTTVNETALDTDLLTFVCECVSWSVLLDRRMIDPYVLDGGIFSAQTLHYIAEHLVYDFCDSEGLEVTCPTGPTFTLNLSGTGDKSIAQALDEAVAAASDATHAYIWFVSPWRVVTIREALTTTAPWNIKDTDGSAANVLVRIERTVTNEKLVNNIFMTATAVLSATVTESFAGNGSTEDWSTTKPMATPPVLDVNGSAQTVGLQNGITAFQWYWQPGSNSITRGTHAVLAGGETLNVNYQPTSSKLYQSRDTASIDSSASRESGTGQWGSHITYSNPIDEADAQAAADAAVLQFSEVPNSLKIDTYRYGLSVGSVIVVTLAKYHYTTKTFLVASLKLTTESNEFKWEAELVNGPRIGDYITAFSSIGSGGSGSGGAFGGGGGSTPPIVTGASTTTLRTPGVLAVGRKSNVGILPIDLNPTGVLASVDPDSGNPTGHTLTFDIKVNGTIWMSLVIAAGTQSVTATPSQLTTAGILAGLLPIRSEITAVGTTFAGLTLQVFIYF